MYVDDFIFPAWLRTEFHEHYLLPNAVLNFLHAQGRGDYKEEHSFEFQFSTPQVTNP